jgi:hypothetical protein
MWWVVVAWVKAVGVAPAAWDHCMPHIHSGPPLLPSVGAEQQVHGLRRQVHLVCQVGVDNATGAGVCTVWEVPLLHWYLQAWAGRGGASSLLPQPATTVVLTWHNQLQQMPSRTPLCFKASTSFLDCVDFPQRSRPSNTMNAPRAADALPCKAGMRSR